MRLRTQTKQIKRERALEIAMNHNCVSRETAERYTDSELQEVLRQVSGYGFKLVLAK